MITLIIVDCQNDFITGTMSVKGARNAVDKIKDFIKEYKSKICKIVFTVDWHPYNHSSFKRYGGQYPHHCIQYTPGACIEPKLLKLVQSLDINYEVCEKGRIEEVEEYGAFNEIDFVADELGQRYYLDIVEVDVDSEFIVCGVSESVKYTIQNMLDGNIEPKIFSSGIASGNDFDEFIKENRLQNV